MESKLTEQPRPKPSFWETVYYSFSIQLLVLHLKKNQVLLLYWIVLFAVVTGHFGQVLGIPFLFLDPEYLNEVSFISFLIMGLVLGGFIMSFNMTGYILDGFRFKRLGTLKRPFTKYCINNTIIPVSFLIVYIWEIIEFQQTSEYSGTGQVLVDISGLLLGIFVMLLAFGLYFKLTNKDFFYFFAEKIDRQFKKRIKATRANVMMRYLFDSKRVIRIDNCFDFPFRLVSIGDEHAFRSKTDRELILKVFHQNHLNAVIIQLSVFGVILLLGIFREWSLFQIPAAASTVLLGTIFMSITGALSFYLRGWSISFIIVTFLIINFLYAYNALWFKNTHEAYGLNYSVPPVPYDASLEQAIRDQSQYEADREKTLQILENWRAKFPVEEAPPLFMICSSGGGLRSALWNYHVLAQGNQLTDGELLAHTMLLTGASGGMVGAAYYRELSMHHSPAALADSSYLSHISRDLLNPVIFTMVVNNILLPPQTFGYAGKTYYKDRGYAFEQQLNSNTDYVLDKPLGAYFEPELQAEIPMMILAPTIINDGRKLYISPHAVGYMNVSNPVLGSTQDEKIKGVDFGRLFRDHGASDLYFPTALRMNASFPYIAPGVLLPTEPAIEIMDAGISDNFGIGDALRFLYVFQDWIKEHTREVVIISVRDTDKHEQVDEQMQTSIIDKFITPVSSVYSNLANIQDITNDNKLEFARSWYDGKLKLIHFVYDPEVKSNMPGETAATQLAQARESQRASLNWHLTLKEKRSILQSITSGSNQASLDSVMHLLEKPRNQ